MSLPPQIWDPNTPVNPQETLIVSAPKIKTNFNSIGNTYGFDHSPLGSATNVGFHNQVTFSNLTSVPVADANSARIFAQIINSIPQLFLQYPSSSSIVNPVQITNSAVPVTYLIPAGGACTVTEVTFVIGGIILKIGTISQYVGAITGLGPTITLTFGGPTSPSPFPTQIISLGLIPSYIGPLGPSSVPVVYQSTNVTTSTFQYTANTGDNCTYLAMGN